MDRAGNVLRKLGLGAAEAYEDLARAAWPRAVGKRISARTRPVGYADGCLLIEVDDTVWLEHLRTMRRQILPRLQALTGKDAVKALDFRQGVPRREPQRAEAPRVQRDEADGIEDSILRRVYKASRKRSA